MIATVIKKLRRIYWAIHRDWLSLLMLLILLTGPGWGTW